jgi:hypothetical protein
MSLGPGRRASTARGPLFCAAAPHQRYKHHAVSITAGSISPRTLHLGRRCQLIRSASLVSWSLAISLGIGEEFLQIFIRQVEPPRCRACNCAQRDRRQMLLYHFACNCVHVAVLFIHEISAEDKSVWIQPFQHRETNKFVISRVERCVI